MYLSIDPGLKGGAVLIDRDGDILSSSLFERGKKDFFDLVYTNKNLIEFIIIENVRGYAGENVKSIFTFGKEVGQVEGILISCGFKIDDLIRIEPRTWVSFFKDVWECKGKQKSCKAIKRLFNGREGFDKISRYDALSDAYLIYYYWIKTRAINRTRK